MCIRDRSRRERNRRRAIELALPDAMELLGIAIAAGSPIEQCFREVAENMDGPLAREFSLVDREVNLLGRSREEALEHLGQRCRSQDVSAFTAQLMQAVSQGSSLTEGLAVQDVYKRQGRRFATAARRRSRWRASPRESSRGEAVSRWRRFLRHGWSEARARACTVWDESMKRS